VHCARRTAPPEYIYIKCNTACAALVSVLRFSGPLGGFRTTIAVLKRERPATWERNLRDGKRLRLSTSEDDARVSAIAVIRRIEQQLSKSKKKGSRTQNKLRRRSQKES